MSEIKTRKLSKQEAIPKIEHFCAYQERCHKEVRSKLYGYGLTTDEVLEVLSLLIKRDFINEERFAKTFAGGKFRQKSWGRAKIIRELKAREISDYCISKALNEIESDDYRQKLEKLALRYLETHKANTPWELKQKAIRYLVAKGYEYDQCHEILSGLIHS